MADFKVGDQCIGCNFVRDVCHNGMHCVINSPLMPDRRNGSGRPFYVVTWANGEVDHIHPSYLRKRPRSRVKKLVKEFAVVTPGLGSRGAESGGGMSGRRGNDRRQDWTFKVGDQCIGRDFADTDFPDYDGMQCVILQALRDSKPDPNSRFPFSGEWPAEFEPYLVVQWSNGETAFVYPRNLWKKVAGNQKQKRLAEEFAVVTPWESVGWAPNEEA